MDIYENRKNTDSLLERFKYWLHIEDDYLIYTILAGKISHRLSADPVWLLIIGNSSDGKSELLRAFTSDLDITLDDLTVNSFVTGYTTHATDEIPQFAEQLKNKTWFIYDMSIMLSKKHEDRSEILSQMRMIYDGKLEKRYGNKKHIVCDTKNNTLIAGSTPAIDSTLLEDQILGTRWITYRTKTKNNWAVMEKIDENIEQMTVMRQSLRSKVMDYENTIIVENIELTTQELQNIKILTDQTRILRCSVELDRNKEIRNIAYPEGSGRLYKQLIKLYKCYRIIGLTEEEAIKGIRKTCIDSIIPVRLLILKCLVLNNDKGFMTTSEIATRCKLGKGHTKGHLSSLNALDIVDYKEVYDEFIRRHVDQWLLVDGNFNLLLDLPPVKNEDHQNQLQK